MISAVSQVRGLNQNSSNISNNFHHTKNEPSFLILKDAQGNMYKYIYPNDMDQFSKMSTLGNKNSTTVIHLPPGILKKENGTFNKTGNIKSLDDMKITSEKPQTTTTKRTINNTPTKFLPDIKEKNNNKPNINKNSSIGVGSTLPKTEKKNSEEEDTIVLTNENEPTETTTIKNIKNEHKTEEGEDSNDTGNIIADQPILKSAQNPNMLPNDNNTKEHSNSMIIERLFLLKKNSEKYENSNEQQNSYKSSDTRNDLLLLVENDIKLKLFMNSKGVLNKSSPENSRKNPTIKLKGDISTEDDMTTINDLPISIIDTE
ncbi:hypothetical protein AGLY_007470 [Aphis glycines]|uniref:Uncharacterized protein n=1 Tax=Aphis glycines TaxID=307491 RepID=A0A6G0TM62_APHGL|nr:hypothetical protein AGLY_007470 [Aphis glycines]